MASLHVASELVKAITNIIYPVGSIYISTNTANPASYLGGTWSQVAKDCYLIGYDTSNTWFDKIGTSKGSNGKSGNWNTDSHTLTVAELPNHNHYFQSSDGTWHDPTVDRSHTTSWGASYSNSGDYKINSATGQKCDGAQGKGHNHFHVSPYYVVSVWRRTA